MTHRMVRNSSLWTPVHLTMKLANAILTLSSVSIVVYAASAPPAPSLESLAKEVAPFGVKVCALEPGRMRTNWGARANRDRPDLLPDYEPSEIGRASCRERV